MLEEGACRCPQLLASVGLGGEILSDPNSSPARRPLIHSSKKVFHNPRPPEPIELNIKYIGD